MNLSGAIWSDASEAAEGESSWWDSVVKSFTDQWWVFVVVPFSPAMVFTTV